MRYDLISMLQGSKNSAEERESMVKLIREANPRDSLILIRVPHNAAQIYLTNPKGFRVTVKQLIAVEHIPFIMVSLKAIRENLLRDVPKMVLDMIHKVMPDV